jgi:AcrR family transcriptional regulator
LHKKTPARKPKNGESNLRKDLVLEQILDKAAELFVRRGYANTRIQDIASELGMGRSSLYHYFRSKDEVLAALTEEVAAAGVQRLEAVFRDEKLSAADRLRKVVLGNILGKLSGGPRFRMLDRIESEMPAHLMASFTKTRRRVLELTAAVIEKGIQTGEFRPIDAKIAAFSIIGMANWTAWWYSPKGEHPPERIAEDMTDLVLNGMLAGRPGHTRAGTIGAAIRQLQDDLKVLQKLAE